MNPSQQAGVWPTTVKVQCRNEPVFEATIRFRQPMRLVATFGVQDLPSGPLTPTITCPHCARDYYLRSDGTWMSDRPLKFIEYV